MSRAVNQEWHVFIHSRQVGYIGTVVESCEEYARCAALLRYSEEGDRSTSDEKVIFEDDDFDVRPSRH